MALCERAVRRSFGGVRGAHQRASRQSDDVVIWDTGRIKWFDQQRRYGFIIADESDIEIFLPWTSLQESNIPERQARIGTPVRFRCKPAKGPGKNPEATHVELIKR